MDILIASVSQDVHAAAVQWGLEQHGVFARYWRLRESLTEHGITMSVAERGTRDISLLDESRRLLGTRMDVLWLRRLGRPAMRSDVHEHDASVVLRENESFMAAVCFELSARSQFCVNPYNARVYAASKSVQLIQAQLVGMKVPATIFSNQPEEVRRFFEQHGENVILKTFTPAAWAANGRVFAAETRKLRIADLEDEAIRKCPAIYQPYIEKAYEIRLTIMGRTCIAVKIDSQRHQETSIDWRTSSIIHDMGHDEVEISDALRAKCFALMAHLGIIFGCFDFIVTPEGEWIFLEVNEMGQFLWQERVNPKIRFLDAFCKFLLSRDPAFDWDRKAAPRATIQKFEESEAYVRFLEDEGKGFHHIASGGLMVNETSIQ